MKILREIDLTDEEAQLRLVMKFRETRSPRHQEALDRLHLMLAKKTLEYYCEDGYDAFFERHHLDYETEDGYRVEVRGHDMSVSTVTPCGVVKGSGTTWDYIEGDLELSVRPSGMDRKAYAAIKRRMQEIQDSEKVLYPFHPLHRIGNGCFDTKICMYNAHKLVKTEKTEEL
jgi:hypothetical protein